MTNVKDFIKNLFEKIKNRFEKEEIIDKIKLDILGISYTSDKNIYVAILGEENGERKVPVVITYTEAQSIAIKIEEIEPIVPLIYDVFKQVSDDHKIEYKEILITKFKNDILTTYLVGKRKNSFTEIRTADALSLSLRIKTPIYITSEALFEVDTMVKKYYNIHESAEQLYVKKNFKGLTLEDLSILLNNAIKNEEYENASEIRDEIKKKKSENSKEN